MDTKAKIFCVVKLVYYFVHRVTSISTVADDVCPVSSCVCFGPEPIRTDGFRFLATASEP